MLRYSKYIGIKEGGIKTREADQETGFKISGTATTVSVVSRSEQRVSRTRVFLSSRVVSRCATILAISQNENRIKDRRGPVAQ